MHLPRNLLLLAASFGWWLALVCIGVTVTAAETNTFKNPIAPNGQDPWVVQWHSQYWYCWSDGNIRISAAAQLQDIVTRPATNAVVWTPPQGQPYSKQVWAPELHFLQGRWYIYFAADDGRNEHHRMFVLQSETENPLSAYHFKGQLHDSTDKWAIDGTVLDHAEKLYFIWSGWAGDTNGQQNLYLAPMSNPWTISGPRMLISEPNHAWERRGGPPYINEGPQVLQKNGRTFLIYSASGSWTDDYCLGQFALTGKDPLSPASWTKHPEPLFAKTTEVFGPGHCSFVKSPDGTEDWIVYHAAISSGSRWRRNLRMQKFTWNGDGTPHFAQPVAAGIELPVPSDSAK